MLTLQKYAMFEHRFMNLRKFENYPNSLYAFVNNHSNMLKDENKIYMFFKEYVIDILFYSAT